MKLLEEIEGKLRREGEKGERKREGKRRGRKERERERERKNLESSRLGILDMQAQGLRRLTATPSLCKKRRSGLARWRSG